MAVLVALPSIYADSNKKFYVLLYFLITVKKKSITLKKIIIKNDGNYKTNVYENAL